MKYLTAAVLFVVFAIASMLGGVFALAGLALGRTRYAANITHSMDMLLAALLGWDGRATVSKECSRSSCRFCRVVCAVLNRVLERDHCRKEASR